MIKDVNGRFDDYFISPKIRQILLHWSYELTESDLLWFVFYFLVITKISYYWFNRQELLQKAQEKYVNGGKEKTAEYYQANKDVIKENLTKEEKETNKIV